MLMVIKCRINGAKHLVRVHGLRILAAEVLSTNIRQSAQVFATTLSMEILPAIAFVGVVTHTTIDLDDLVLEELH